LSIAQSSIALVIAEAVLDTDDDPTVERLAILACDPTVSCMGATYHRFVKTTPKPSATKKRRGDDDPPRWLLFPPFVAVAVGAVDDVVAIVAQIYLTRLGYVRRQAKCRAKTAMPDVRMCGAIPSIPDSDLSYLTLAGRKRCQNSECSVVNSCKLSCATQPVTLSFR
jgi:hypothetical protein